MFIFRAGFKAFHRPGLICLATKPVQGLNDSITYLKLAVHKLSAQICPDKMMLKLQMDVGNMCKTDEGKTSSTSSQLSHTLTH